MDELSDHSVSRSSKDASDVSISEARTAQFEAESNE